MLLCHKYLFNHYSDVQWSSTVNAWLTWLFWKTFKTLHKTFNQQWLIIIFEAWLGVTSNYITKEVRIENVHFKKITFLIMGAHKELSMVNVSKCRICLLCSDSGSVLIYGQRYMMWLVEIDTSRLTALWLARFIDWGVYIISVKQLQ